MFLDDELLKIGRESKLDKDSFVGANYQNE